MDLDRIILELQAERKRLDEAIEALERLAPTLAANKRTKARATQPDSEAESSIGPDSMSATAGSDS